MPACAKLPHESFHYAAPRPAILGLGSERGVLLPSLDRAIDSFFHDCQVSWKAEAEIIEPVVRRAREARSRRA
jgi:hypothetical protein